MKKIIFYLETCSTCKRIMQEIGVGDSWILREIKSSPITEQELEMMKERAGSYEALFSKRARKYRELGLNEKKLNEEEYKSYILSEYTFLKRPVFSLDGEVFVGNSKKTVELVKNKLA